jgi:hypothetical protein
MGLVLAYRQVPWAYGSAIMLVHADLLRTLTIRAAAALALLAGDPARIP